MQGQQSLFFKWNCHPSTHHLATSSTILFHNNFLNEVMDNKERSRISIATTWHTPAVLAISTQIIGRDFDTASRTQCRKLESRPNCRFKGDDGSMGALVLRSSIIMYPGLLQQKVLITFSSALEMCFTGPLRRLIGTIRNRQKYQLVAANLKETEPVIGKPICYTNPRGEKKKKKSTAKTRHTPGSEKPLARDNTCFLSAH